MRWLARFSRLRKECMPVVVVILLVMIPAGTLAESAEARNLDSTSEIEVACRKLAERWQTLQQGMTTPVENILIPIAHYPSGRIRAQLSAGRAQIFLDGVIFAEGVTVHLLTESGARSGEFSAESCVFNRKGKVGYCKGRISMALEGDHVVGRDMYFSFERQYIKILSECEIRTHRVNGSFGRLR